MNELQFADDAALLTTTRTGAEKALHEYNLVASTFGPTVSMTKTKVMATGREAIEVDMAPISLGKEEVENVSQFPYLVSAIHSSGRAEVDVGRRLAQASKAISVLCKAVFWNKDLTLKTKYTIYQVCVFSGSYPSS